MHHSYGVWVTVIPSCWIAMSGSIINPSELDNGIGMPGWDRICSSPPWLINASIGGNNCGALSGNVL